MLHIQVQNHLEQKLELRQDLVAVDGARTTRHVDRPVRENLDILIRVLILIGQCHLVIKGGVLAPPLVPSKLGTLETNTNLANLAKKSLNLVQVQLGLKLGQHCDCGHLYP